MAAYSTARVGVVVVLTFLVVPHFNDFFGRNTSYKIEKPVLIESLHVWFKVCFVHNIVYYCYQRKISVLRNTLCQSFGKDDKNTSFHYLQWLNQLTTKIWLKRIIRPYFNCLILLEVRHIFIPTYVAYIAEQMHTTV